VDFSAGRNFRVKRLFELLLAARLLFPFYDSPLTHLYSDPQRHWDNGALFTHPSILGSNDPYLYQVWMFALRWISHGNASVVLLGCGILCAAMPIGWYRALREVLPKSWALGGAIVIALIPESISLYAYFMNETLLMTLLGFCFWLTLRSWRKQTIGAYTLACIAWSCAALTRTVALPMAIGCLAGLWLIQSQRLPKLMIAMAVACLLAVPAGLHAQRNLNYFAPFGNLYFNSIYHDSGMHDIAVDYGPLGRFQFGAPSFYGPTYLPFSNWTTDRRGVAHISINTVHGREDWKRERARIRSQRLFPIWRQRWEDFQYLLFGLEWPNSNGDTVQGMATVWGRWLWPALLLFLSWALVRGWFLGRAWLLPVCGLGTIALLAMQTQGVTEARFREPIDQVLMAAAVCAIYFRYARPKQSAKHSGAAQTGPLDLVQLTGLQ
jgi:Dolichyl-phosphate-mannose-protein mannosyltransferase